MQAGERRHRAAGAKQADTRLISGQPFRKGTEALCHPLPHPGIGGNSRFGITGIERLAFSERHDAPRRALPIQDMRSRPFRVDQHKFSRSPANVKDERGPVPRFQQRSEEHTSELKSLMSISYAVYGFKKKQTNKTQLN